MLVTVLSPLLLVLAVVVDLVRRKPIAIRLLGMLWWFLAGELRGILMLGLIWVAAGGRDTRTRRRRVYRLRQSWAAGHIGGVRRLFGLRFEVEGLDTAAPGPVLVFIRHASIIDNMMPDAVIGRAHDLGLRFVLKRELRMLPTIDIGGGWVPTVFVHRASGDTAAETAKLALLAQDLAPDEGILIYPEGTRYTPKKLARAQEIIRERQPEIAPYADRLTSLLPPRLGGPLALLEACPGVDVVFCAHVGFDGFEYISDVWKGGLIGTTVKIKLWRVPPPEGDAAAWLYDQWLTMDDWVSRHRASAIGTAAG